jgi:hypothetical protein
MSHQNAQAAAEVGRNVLAKIVEAGLPEDAPEAKAFRRALADVQRANSDRAAVRAGQALGAALNACMTALVRLGVPAEKTAAVMIYVLEQQERRLQPKAEANFDRIARGCIEGVRREIVAEGWPPETQALFWRKIAEQATAEAARVSSGAAMPPAADVLAGAAPSRPN